MLQIPDSTDNREVRILGPAPQMSASFPKLSGIFALKM